MPNVGRTTLSEFEGILQARRSKLTTGEAHALFLGGVTSTSLQLHPLQLVSRIFDDEDLPEDKETALDMMVSLFGYWNHLLEERRVGRVRLAPRELPPGATRDELLAHARARESELLWYVRGIDAGGDDPLEFGEDGEQILRRIAEAGGFLDAYVQTLSGECAASEEELAEAREGFVMLDETLEMMISDLMEISDQVRHEALDTYQANRGRLTDDGVRIPKAPRPPRNAPCPCGSGKKYKRCCGFAPVH
jgi:hypothetical protein